MTTRFAVGVLCVLGIAGCIAPEKLRFVDVPHQGSVPAVQHVRAQGDILTISVVQNGGVVFVSSVEPQVIKGDVYLRLRCISSVVQATEFSVDLSGIQFPRDWRQRLYWVEQDAISSPINPFIEPFREIHRSKILVE
jgi:hypothetical protein